ncbi:FtsX-like permease family protein [Porcipelethomonas sp.]|uniref:FtsX-like permease family protein n=1 Tax=Porcipelethomonas sp. TaxID=2981675 RepID=UPI003EF2DBEA
MKKTQWINLYRDIRKTLVSFISIALFVALGIAIFLGIRWNEPAISARTNQYLTEHNYHDFLLSFPYGFTPEDIDAISELDDISMVEGSYSAFGSSWVNDQRYILVIQALTNNMDKADVIEGKMPEAPDEIGIERLFAEAAGIEIGDKITVNTENDGKSYLKNTKFTVTAIVSHPSYFSNGASYSRGLSNIGDGSVDYFALMSEDAFDADTYDNCYSQILLRSDKLEGLDCFGESYENESDLIAENIKEIGAERAKKRCLMIEERADAEIASADKMITDAEAELENGQKEIADGKTEIEQAELDIAEGEKKISDSEDELEKGRQQVAESKKLISEAELEIADSERKILQNEKTLESAKLAYSNALAEYTTKKEELETVYSEFQNSLGEAGFSTDIDTAETQIKDKRTELVELLKQAESTKEELDTAYEMLKSCNGDITAADPDEMAELLSNLARETGYTLDPLYIGNLRVQLCEASACLDKYISDPASLTESEAETVNRLLETSGLSLDTDGAEELKMYADNALIALDLYEANPELAYDKDFQTVVYMMSVLNFQPNTSYAVEEIEIKQSEVQEKIQELNDGIEKLDGVLDGIATYRSGKEMLSAAEKELYAAQIQISEGIHALDIAKNNLSEGKSELEMNKNKLTEAEEKISDGESELAEKKAELTEAKNQLAIAKQELPEAEDKISDGKAALTEKKAELYDIKSRLEEFISYDNWTVQGRNDNSSISSARFYSESSRKLCFSMALLFVFVGLMVCYTSVSRNVNEMKTLTGVQKALGFRRKEITAHYMAYSVAAVLIGSVFGCLSGYFIIEAIINNAYLKRFSLGVIHKVFVFSDAMAIILVETVLICLATWIPCRKLFKRSAVELMRGDNTGNGHTRFYEKLKLWNKLSLYSQTTVNNLVNDSSRVIATLVGISGCAALIVVSMALQMSIYSTPKKHFSDIWLYDASLVCDNSVDGAHDILENVLEEEAVDYMSLLRDAVFIEGKDGDLSKADLVVPEPTDNLENFIRIKDWKTKKTLSLPSDGAVISRTFQKHNDVDVGDTIRFMDTKGVYHEIVISGVSEHYLSTIQITMSPEYYETVMLKSAESNTFYLNYGEADAVLLQEKLQNTNGFFSLTDECTEWTSVFMEVSSVTKLIVYIGLFLAAVMALLVLLNLNIVCVNEKSKELTIMRINGFSISAVKKYIYRDNIVLTIVGIIIGIIFGMGVGKWILTILQKNMDNFYTVPSPVTCLTAVVLTTVFALITNLIALRRIKNLNVHDLTR